MWFKRKENKEGFVKHEKIISESCVICGCVVEKTKIKMVKREILISYGMDELQYYCSRCKPPYDKITVSEAGVFYYRFVPEHYVFVESDGRDVKSKSKEKKNVPSKNKE